MQIEIHRRTTVLITVDDDEAFRAAAAAEGIALEKAEEALAIRVERGERPSFPGVRYKVETETLKIVLKK